MIANLKTKETHVKTVQRIFTGRELTDLLANTVADMAGMGKGTEGVTVSVRFEDETAGSPPYKAGTRAIVTIETDVIERERILELRRSVAEETRGSISG